MSIKAKIMILLKYGGSWSLGAALQLALLVLLWRATHGARRRWAVGLWASFFLAYLVIPVDYVLGLTFPAALYRAVVLPALAWQFGTGLALAGLAVIRAVGAVRSWRGWGPKGPATFVALVGVPRVRVAMGMLFFLGALLPAWGMRQALAPPCVVRISIPVRGLRAPVSVLHVTDLHTGYFCGPAELARVVRLARELSPDLVVLTGDQLHGAHAPFSAWLRDGLTGLTAPSGVYQVAGNHDYRTGVQTLFEALKPLGVVALHDEHRVVATPGGPLVLAGVNDLYYGGRLDRTLAGRPPELPVVLLSHRPDVLPAAAAAGVDVVLAGHTHGGQVCLAGVCLSDFEGPYRRGLYHQGGTVMVVSSGVGTTGLPLRLFSPPEVALITLEPAP